MTGKSKRGFASMDRERQREIAAKGGKAAHAKGTAHVWTASEAREAGRKGGEAVSQDRLHMSAIGKEGGESRSAALRAARLRVSQEQRVAGTSGAFQLNGDREVPIPTSREGVVRSEHVERFVANAPRAEGLADVRSGAADQALDEHPPERPPKNQTDKTVRAGASLPVSRVRPAFEERSST